MKAKIESLVKLIPLITVFCYITGFIVYNTHLAEYGIVDLNFFSLRYIAAGILYTSLSSLILAAIHKSIIIYENKKYKRIKSLIASLISSGMIYSFFVSFMCGDSIQKSYQNDYITLGIMVLLAFFLIENLLNKSIDWIDAPIYIFLLGVGSLFLFGSSFKYIKTKVGGGKAYKNILVLDKELTKLIKVDSLNMTDTLTILHQNSENIYILNKGNIQCIKEDNVLSKILIK